MQGWRITSRRKQTTRIETRRQKPPLQSLFFFFRSQQKIGFLCAKMKAGTVVLFTLFLPVIAGPPVEAAESDFHFPSLHFYLSRVNPHDRSKQLYEKYLRYLQDSQFPDVPYGRIKSYLHYMQYMQDTRDFPDVPYGRIIWCRLYEWSEVQEAAVRNCSDPSDIYKNYSKMSEFEGTYEIKLEDLLKLGELKEHAHHLKTGEFKDFISNFREFKDFIGNFIDDNEFEIFLQNYTQEAKAIVKAMTMKKETLESLALESSMESLALAPKSYSLDSSMDSLALDSSMDSSMESLDSLDSLDSYSSNSSMAVESTKRQRSIIFGLTTLTIFAGLALLLFWILEEQKKKSRTNIKA